MRHKDPVKFQHAANLEAYLNARGMEVGHDPIYLSTRGMQLPRDISEGVMMANTATRITLMHCCRMEDA